MARTLFGPSWHTRAMFAQAEIQTPRAHHRVSALALSYYRIGREFPRAFVEHGSESSISLPHIAMTSEVYRFQHNKVEQRDLVQMAGSKQSVS